MAPQNGFEDGRRRRHVADRGLHRAPQHRRGAALRAVAGEVPRHRGFPAGLLERGGRRASEAVGCDVVVPDIAPRSHIRWRGDGGALPPNAPTARASPVCLSFLRGCLAADAAGRASAHKLLRHDSQRFSDWLKGFVGWALRAGGFQTRRAEPLPNGCGRRVGATLRLSC